MTRRIASPAAILLLLLGIGAGGEARAARETDVAASLHGEIGIGFEGSGTRGHLQEDGVRVGQVVDTERGFRVNLRFGILPGLELFSAIPSVRSGSRTFSNVSQMLPCNDGTLQNAEGQVWYTQDTCAFRAGSALHLETDTLSDNAGKFLANGPDTTVPTYTWSGMDDVVVGLRFAPLHEAELGQIGSGRKLGQRPFRPYATWRLEAGLVLNSGDNFYARGAATGTTGFRLGTSFSKRLGVSDPYLTVSHTRFGDYEAFASDEAGNPVTLVLDPPNQTDLFFGIELIPYEDPASGAKFSVDFAGGGFVRSASTVISGTWLPSLVESGYLCPNNGAPCTESSATVEVQGTEGTVQTEESQTAFQLRLRLHYQLFRYMRIQAGGNLAYLLPHQLESSYNIKLGRAVYTQFGLEASTTF